MPVLRRRLRTLARVRSVRLQYTPRLDAEEEPLQREHRRRILEHAVAADRNFDIQLIECLLNTQKKTTFVQTISLNLHFGVEIRLMKRIALKYTENDPLTSTRSRFKSYTDGLALPSRDLNSY